MIDKQNVGLPDRNEQPAKIRHQPGELLGMYRRRADLSQVQLASLLGFKSDRMLQMWEGDYSLPTAVKLKKLIEIYLGRSVFTVDSEQREAAELWQTIKSFFDTNRERRLDTYPLFDKNWFASQLTIYNAQPLAIEPLPAPNLLLIAPKLEIPTNLPASLNRLIGREAEILLVSNLLEHKRLLTLTGPGGTGKTRLALAVATWLQDEFKHGIWWVELAAVTDPDQVGLVIAQTLGLQETAGQTPTENLKSYISGKEILLVLDNFEQVITAAPLVIMLLAAAPALKILVTSRETLHVYSEQKFIVPPLPLPLLDQKPALTELSRNAAIQLFVERAQLAQTNFELTAANVEAVAELCIFLEGLPLAIELTAAQSEFFTPAVLLGQLQESQQAVRLRLLIDGPRDIAPRQQTLRNTMEWSFQLLEPDEQRLFAELGVFVGGWTVAVAGDVCTQLALATTPMLKRLQKLSAKSLLTVVSDADGEPRFGMLETIREFAVEQLALHYHYNEDKLLEDYAAHFVKFTDQAYPLLFSSEQIKWLNRIEQEPANIRKILGWACQVGVSTYYPHSEVALRLCVSSCYFWEKRGYIVESRRWLEAAIQTVPLPPPLELTRYLAMTIFALSHSTYWQGDYTYTAQLIEKSLILFQIVDDKQNQANCFGMLAIIAHHQGHYTEAIILYQRNMDVQRALGDKPGVVLNLNNIGVVYIKQGRYAEAEVVCLEALVMAREVGNRNNVARCLNYIGGLKMAQADYLQAQAVWQEALELQQQVVDKQAMAEILVNLGELNRKLGNYVQAQTLLEQGLTLQQELDEKRGVAETLLYLGNLALNRGDYKLAQTYYKQRLLLRCEFDDKSDIAQGLTAVALWCSDQAQLVPAVILGSKAEAIRTALGVALAGDEVAFYQHQIAEAKLKLGETEFVRLVAVGQAMTLEQAVAYALEIPVETAIQPTHFSRLTVVSLNAPAFQVTR